MNTTIVDDNLKDSLVTHSRIRCSTSTDCPYEALGSISLLENASSRRRLLMVDLIRSPSSSFSISSKVEVGSEEVARWWRKNGETISYRFSTLIIPMSRSKSLTQEEIDLL